VRVLSVTHGPSVPGGVFDETVEARGHRLDHWSVPLGRPVGKPEDYDAIMVFGGSMHPDEGARHDWMEPEVDFLRVALERDVPLFGVCLGAQLIARAAGARVGPAVEPEIGWLAVELTATGRADRVLGVLPPRFEAFQWHRYTFGLPDGGGQLAASSVCPQAFRFGSAWGIQFHAEVTRAMVDAWIAEDGDELPFPHAELHAETDRHLGAWNEHGRELCGAFLDAAR
jgi:GMP synthase (glutamine-hydrolysing)